MKTSEAVLRIKVQKKNPAGDVTVEYEGDVLQRDDSHRSLTQRLIQRKALFKVGQRQRVISPGEVNTADLLLVKWDISLVTCLLDHCQRLL